MKLRGIVTLVAVLAFCTGTASAQSIGVYFDAAGTVCAGEMPNGNFTFYVLGILGGGTAGGLQGAEFKMEGHRFPSPWFGNCEAATELVIGNVTGAGVAVSFTECQTTSPVLLFTCSGFNSENPTPPGSIEIVGHDTPSNTDFPCPHQNDCQTGQQTCSRGDGSDFGPGAERECAGIIAVNEATWSTVKGLYSN